MTIGVPEQGERRLALRMASALWTVAAISNGLMLLLPGAVTRHWRIDLAMCAAIAAWAVACLLIPPQRAGVVVFHTPALLAVPMIAIAIASTGGAHSKMAFEYFYVVSYCAYFYTYNQALVYAGLAGVAACVPLLYDHDAVREGFLVQLLVTVPAYLLLGLMMGGARRRLLGLRDAAEHLSLTDPLTGLPNRRAFTERIGRSIGGERASDVTGLLMLDLDDFKEINTRFGHPGGDEALRSTASALRSAVRSDDMVARIGGDEFALVVSGLGVDEMGQLAARVLDAVRSAGARLGSRLPGVRLTASVGWAVHPEMAATEEELMAAADVSLRGVKRSGKDGARSGVDLVDAL
jgi:diguanylate cyclase (GGDEF)-like protein